jgi:uncharacterized protein (DUF1778 family)
MKSETPKNTSRTKQLNPRATGRKERLIRAGAAARGVSVADFLMESACLQAEQVLAYRREFIVSPKLWEEFLAALDRPARVNSSLARLFSKLATNSTRSTQ